MSTISTKINDLKALDYITEVVTPDFAIEDYGDDLKVEDLTTYVTQVGIASELKKQFDSNSVPAEEVEPSTNDDDDAPVVDDNTVDDNTVDDNTVDGNKDPEEV